MSADSPSSNPWLRASELLYPTVDEQYDWLKKARPEQLPPPGDWWVHLLMQGRGAGKQLLLSVAIPTPDGWVTMGDITPGQMVFDENGKPTKVLAVFDGMPDRAYRLTFSDGTFIDACGDHEWVTWTHAERKAFLRSPYEDIRKFPDDWPNWRLKRLSGNPLNRDRVEPALKLSRAGLSMREIESQLGISRASIAKHVKADKFVEPIPKVYSDSPGPQVRTTQQIVETLKFGKRGDTNHCIPLAKPLQLPDIGLPLDPWLLGYWLGNGATNSGLICSHRQDEPFVREQVTRAGFGAGQTAVLSDPDKQASNFTVYELVGLLDSMGLKGNKHVPKKYLRASIEQRSALLAGLLDSDGYLDPTNSQVEFCSTMEVLADAVIELARSLGQKPTKTYGRAKLYGKDCGPKWRVFWRPTVNPFMSPRKRKAYIEPEGQSLRNHHRMIVSIEPIPLQPMRCITVDSPNSLYLAGEGMIPTHNTRTGAETVKGWAGYQRLPNLESRPGCRIAVVSPTAADARDVCMEGDSGLLSVLPSDAIKNWNRSMGELTLKNGTKIKTYSAEEPERLRGPQFHFGWCDEIGAWTKQQETWDQLMFGLRLGKKPKVIATTTPRPTKLIRELVVRDGVHVTRGSTFDNAANLAPTALAELKQKYENTRLGRQELYAELLLDTPGALWTLDLIDRNRVREVPDMVRIAVAVDPSGGEGEGHDEQGIIVVGKGTDGEGYCLDDRSCSLSPDGWARRTVQAYLDYAADVIIVEKNFGGDMAMYTVQMAARDMGIKVNIGYVSATRGKQLRAEPVAALFEQDRFHMFGLFEDLESQLTSWTPSSGKSPDRIDALVMGATELLLEKDRPKMRFYS